MTTVTQKYTKDVRRQISYKINRIPLKYYDGHQYGDTLSIITNDVDTVGSSMQQAASMLISSIFMLAGVLVAMFVTCWQMALTVLLIGAVYDDPAPLTPNSPCRSSENVSNIWAS